MSEYQYPDESERITAAMIKALSPGRDYWEKSEKQALDIARRVIWRSFGGEGPHIAVDVGAGEGRLISWLLGFASEVVVVEPDRQRSVVAQRTAEARSNANALSFSKSISDGCVGSPEVVLCSHVLQHVSQAAGAALLHEITRIAVPGTLLVLFAAHGEAPQRFTLETFTDGRYESVLVDEEVFNEYASGMRQGALPVRFLVAADLVRRLADVGWREIVRWEYHIANKSTDIRTTDDMIANATPGRNGLVARGRDVMLVLEWMGSP